LQTPWERPDIISYDPLGRGSEKSIHLHIHNLFTLEAGGTKLRNYCKHTRQKFAVTLIQYDNAINILFVLHTLLKTTKT
jgi:hypothetical protein